MTDMPKILVTIASMAVGTASSEVAYAALDAVAEYIAANDEYDAARRAWDNRLAGSKGLRDVLDKASARRAAAHARMKGETK